MTAATHCSSDDYHCSAIIFNARDIEGRRALAKLRADPRVTVVDRWKDQVASARHLVPPFEPYQLADSKRWAYYPWRRTLVSILERHPFRALRLDRNRNLITAEEQHELAGLRVGVVGLSVGHAIAYLLAAEGLCGQLRLADFDTLELSDLNRVPGTVFDLGTNKAITAARRIAELDPYLPVEVMRSALCEDTLAEFLDGLDIIVEECDSLDTKIRLRKAARALQIPVFMATGDRGLLDVERFDLDPVRRILHGLLADADADEPSDVSNRGGVPSLLRIVDAVGLSARSAASLVEVDQTLSAWPQLAGEVALGAAAVAEAVRRFGLGEHLPSGRTRVDVAHALDSLAEPALPPAISSPAEEGIDEGAAPAWLPASDLPAIVAAAANRAPSVGNLQPWHIETDQKSVTIRLSCEHPATWDIGFRASAVAVGSALFNAKVAAANLGVLGSTEVSQHDGDSPLSAVIQLRNGSDANLTRLYEAMLLRETNRHRGVPVALDDNVASALEAAAGAEGARLQLLTGRQDIAKIATIVAAAERIRYLTPRMHAEMLSEIRRPAEDSLESGIDMRSLELDPAELSNFQITLRGDVISKLAEWGTGTALGRYTRDRVSASSGLGVVSILGDTLTDYARGGSAMEAVWITAQHFGLAVQPVAPVFLYARSGRELRELSAEFAIPLHRLQCAFRAFTHTTDDEALVVMLRFSYAPATSVRSLRRSVNGAGTPANCT